MKVPSESVFIMKAMQQATNEYHILQSTAKGPYGIQQPADDLNTQVSLP